MERPSVFQNLFLLRTIFDFLAAVDLSCLLIAANTKNLQSSLLTALCNYHIAGDTRNPCLQARGGYKLPKLLILDNSKIAWLMHFQIQATCIQVQSDGLSLDVFRKYADYCDIYAVDIADGSPGLFSIVSQKMRHVRYVLSSSKVYYEFGGVIVRDILDNCPQLECLYGMFGGVHGSCLDGLKAGFPTLHTTYLHLVKWEHVDIHILASVFPNLTHLILDRTSLATSPEETLSVITRGFPHLVYAGICMCPQFPTFRDIATHFAATSDISGEGDETTLAAVVDREGVHHLSAMIDLVPVPRYHVSNDALIEVNTE